ncbi:ABC transporter permease [Naasia lichenicola]|uniref:ABC transporter permease n=1 Tax=Naasia lichenicola TaxID=2565933 RepID=A0A4S4FPV4_9MICO|nr:ABC transporter permease [Naasia lichenicola]THG31615.1 ABC transporter permease [Naasia lichenicola]
MATRSISQSARTVTPRAVGDDTQSSSVRALVFLRDRGIIVLWLFLVLVFSIWAAPYFFSLANAALVANAAALTAIFAAAVAFGVLSGALDLSVPGSATMGSVVGATVLTAGAPAVVGIAAALATGVVIGTVNGVLVQRGLNPLVVTIGMLTVLGGLAQVVAGGVPINGITQLNFMGSISYFGIPAPVIVVAIIFLIGTLFLTQTRAGGRLMAVGTNAEAVRRVGVSANKYRIIGFILSATVAAVGGLTVTATTTQASPNPSVALLFSALTAVALSGMPLTGGRGSLPRVLVGALIIATISSALVIKGVPPYVATIVTGVLLVAALAFDRVMSSAVAKRLVPTSASADPEPVGPPAIDAVPAAATTATER